MTLNIVFAGTPEFAIPSLMALLNSPHHVIAVYTQPDRPAGRGKKIAISPIKALALKHECRLFQPNSFKSEKSIEQLAALNSDVMIVAAYGLILPQTVLDIPRLGCINVHASLLPRWRGASPIQHAILYGDAKTGITLMQMDQGLDTGDIVSMSPINISRTETSGSLHDKLAEVGAQAVLDLLPRLVKGQIMRQPQENRFATYAHKIQKKDARIDWNKETMIIERQIRAFNPYPIAYSIFDKQPLRIYKAQPVQLGSKPPGTITLIHAEPIVATKDGGIKLITVQLPGKKIITGRDFANAYLKNTGDNIRLH